MGSSHTASECVVSLLQGILNIKQKTKQPSGKNYLESNLLIGREIRRMGEIKAWEQAHPEGP